MTLRPYRSSAILLLALHLNACMTWQPSTVGLRELIEERRPEQIRVTKIDGSRLTLRNPTVEADSIDGNTLRESCGPKYGCVDIDVRVRLALEDVTAVDTWRLGIAGTAATAPTAGTAGTAGTPSAAKVLGTVALVILGVWLLLQEMTISVPPPQF